MNHFKNKLFFQLADKFKIDSTNSKWAITKMNVTFSKNDNLFQVNFPRNDLNKFIKPISDKSDIKDLSISIPTINFMNVVLQDILDNTIKKDDNFERIYPHHNSGKSVIIEFSSPNIAKPFHAGHLRSTILGSFLANLHQTMDIKPIKLNYLGDWGTQLGLVLEGIKQNNNIDNIQNLTLNCFYDAYVQANKNENLISLAKERFQRLEAGKESELEGREWKSVKDITIKNLSETYKRLGISFDYYDSESLYHARSDNWLQVFKILLENNLVQIDEDGCLKTKYGQPLLRSDGTSLYLSRDIAAAIDRHNRFQFHQMLYIVDQTQKAHLDAMVQILKDMNFSWANQIKHIGFGRILGMSTRKGTAIFLSDILDEARLKTLISRKESPNTRESVNDVEDILGVSAVIINDLGQRRKKDYKFSWEKAVAVKGDTAIKLHYVHCRLFSIEENSGISLPMNANGELLQDDIAIELILHLACFDEILYSSLKEYEAYLLVIYLFKLVNLSNKAIKTLNVKNAPVDIAQQRALLFYCSRIILNQGMKILGIPPLKRM